MGIDRITNGFKNANSQNRAALVTYMMAGAPNLDESAKILKELSISGADIIELGMPFSDPMADGPVIQKAAQVALESGTKIKHLLQITKDFRQENNTTPIILMGYYNPLHNYGLEKFCEDAGEAGIDGLLIVDLPIEEEAELKKYSENSDLGWIRLITPTTDEERTQLITKSASGFLYYVAVAGVTGTKSANTQSIETAVNKIKKYSNIPIAVGFGIKSPEDVSNVAKSKANGIVVGSSIVKISLEQNITDIANFVKELSSGLSWQ